ncbi:complex I assembly factor ACAD9, mitochondrial-like [Paramacrobiotus metropolitanus]|uniref:complex I assembly factor ACAD9, mitochondrial-like n=1 Tax=Paramacrobiotus metropolitanus TaxID=2943436 RepID=UPI002445F876|nr:complex I assembly factor ACAD9, mitochondrial-like [Paramacrobiotus metropolitanus]
MRSALHNLTSRVHGSSPLAVGKGLPFARTTRASLTPVQPSRCQVTVDPAAVVGIQNQATKGDEFELIRKKTREYLERPKKDRAPFIKYLFVKQIDPTYLEYPQLDLEQLNTLRDQCEPVINKMKSDVDPGTIDFNETIPADLIAALSNSGAFVHTIPRTHDGNDLDVTGYTRMVESLSLNGNISLGVLAYHQGSWASRIISKYGTEEQKNFYLPKVAKGDATFSVGIAEAESGSDVANMQCSVRMGPDNRGYIINGKKSWVINAHKTNYFLIVAKHEGTGLNIEVKDPTEQFQMMQAKQGSMSVLLIPKKAPGISVQDPVDFIGLRGLQVSEVHFNDVAVSLDSLVGQVGAGFSIAMDAVASQRHVIGAICLPLLRKMIDGATQHMVHRKLFNRHLTEFHMMREKLVETTFLTYALESVTYMTSLLMDQTVKPEFDMEAAAVRVLAANIVPQCITNIMQIYGAEGVTTNSYLELALRDFLTLSQLDGGTDVARLFIALSGFQFAGMQLMDHVNKINNPKRNPWYAFKFNMKSEFTSQRKVRKRTVFLEDYLHPTFQHTAIHLEDCCNRLHLNIENLLLRHHKELIHQQMHLRRISEAVTLVYACFAALGRASRSYCLGIKNAELEMQLATLFAQYVDQKIHWMCEEIEEDTWGRDAGIHPVVNFMVRTKGYSLEHALSRNY